MSGSADSERPLLLGEWACLGVLYVEPTHGFAVSKRLAPLGDVGRVWALSRALTYRSLDQLVARNYVHPVGEEPGIAGGNRTVMAATRLGRSRLRRWLATPVAHLRDVRSELLLKLVLADLCEVDVTAMLRLQRDQIAELSDRLAEHLDTDDVVALWRSESSDAALRFLDRLLAAAAGTPTTFV